MGYDPPSSRDKSSHRAKPSSCSSRAEPRNPSHQPLLLLPHRSLPRSYRSHGAAPSENLREDARALAHGPAEPQRRAKSWVLTSTPVRSVSFRIPFRAPIDAINNFSLTIIVYND